MQSRTLKRSLGIRLIGLTLILMLAGALVVAVLSVIDDSADSSERAAGQVVSRTSHVDDVSDTSSNPGSFAVRARQRRADVIADRGVSRWIDPDSRGDTYLHYPELHAEPTSDRR